MNLDVKVTVRGGIFKGDIPRIVEKQIVHEILAKVEERTRRSGKGLGAQRNTITHSRDRMELGISTTKINPRRTGRAYQKKNIGIVKAMAPRVANKAALRIVEELGGA